MRGFSRRRRAAAVAAVALALGACGGRDAQRTGERAGGDAAAGRPRILLSTKGPGGGNPFWAEVERGAREAAAELSVDLVVLAPPTEADVEIQISQIEDQLVKGIDALVVAPTDVAGLNPTFERAEGAGVPVLFVDTDADWEGERAFVGTDNRAGGRLAGELLGAAVGAGAEVALITGVMSHATHIERVEGARAALRRVGVKVVAQLAADSDRAKAQSAAEDILTAHPDVAGLFASSDLMALGALEALAAAGRLPPAAERPVLVVGFDAIPEAVERIRAGEMLASVAQSPRAMGRRSIEAARRVLAGEGIPARIDTGTRLVTAESPPGGP